MTMMDFKVGDLVAHIDFPDVVGTIKKYERCNHENCEEVALTLDDGKIQMWYHAAFFVHVA